MIEERLDWISSALLLLIGLVFAESIAVVFIYENKLDLHSSQIVFLNFLQFAVLLYVSKKLNIKIIESITRLL